MSWLTVQIAASLIMCQIPYAQLIHLPLPKRLCFLTQFVDLSAGLLTKLCIFMALMALFVILPCYCSLVACVFAAWCYAYAQPMLSCGVCLSGCLSRSWNLSKQINISSKFFSPSGSHTILIFSISNVTEILWWEPPNGGIECRWRRQKSPFTTSISGLITCCERFDFQVQYTQLHRTVASWWH